MPVSTDLSNRIPIKYSISWNKTILKTVFFFFLGPHPQHMEVPRLGAGSELQLPVYTTATAMPDLSWVYDLHHSSWQCQIPNSLSKAREWPKIFMVASWFVTDEPQWELPTQHFLKWPKKKKSYKCKKCLILRDEPNISLTTHLPTHGAL